MNPEWFCFWLQGYFEISECKDSAVIELKPDVFKCIKAHLNLVLKTIELKGSESEFPQAMDFVNYMKSMFDAAELLQVTSFDRYQTLHIRTKLNNVFIHEIDPSFGDDDVQVVLNEAHNEYKPTFPNYFPKDDLSWKKPVMRC